MGVPAQRCAHPYSPENSTLELVGEAAGQDCGSTAARPRFESTPNAPTPYADQQVYHYNSAGMPTSSIPLELVCEAAGQDQGSTAARHHVFLRARDTVFL